MHLTVIHEFADYKRGDKIRDEATMAEIMTGDNHRHVVRSADKADDERN